MHITYEVQTRTLNKTTLIDTNICIGAVRVLETNMCHTLGHTFNTKCSCDPQSCHIVKLCSIDTSD